MDLRSSVMTLNLFEHARKHAGKQLHSFVGVADTNNNFWKCINEELNNDRLYAILCKYFKIHSLLKTNNSTHFMIQKRIQTSDWSFTLHKSTQIVRWFLRYISQKLEIKIFLSEQRNVYLVASYHLVVFHQAAYSVLVYLSGERPSFHFSVSVERTAHWCHLV